MSLLTNFLAPNSKRSFGVEKCQARKSSRREYT